MSKQAGYICTIRHITNVWRNHLHSYVMHVVASRLKSLHINTDSERNKLPKSLDNKGREKTRDEMNEKAGKTFHFILTIKLANAYGYAFVRRNLFVVCVCSGSLQKKREQNNVHCHS